MIKHYYYYLVLFITLMMSIIGSVIVYKAVVDYMVPRTYSFTDYTMKMEKQVSNTAVEDLIQSYKDTVAAEKLQMKNAALNGIIKNLGFVIIPLPIFFYFQRQIRSKE